MIITFTNNLIFKTGTYPPRSALKLYSNSVRDIYCLFYELICRLVLLEHGGAHERCDQSAGREQADVYRVRGRDSKVLGYGVRR